MKKELILTGTLGGGALLGHHVLCKLSFWYSEFLCKSYKECSHYNIPISVYQSIQCKSGLTNICEKERALVALQ